MEFGIPRTIQLASSSLAGRSQVCNQLADLVSDMSQTGSSYGHVDIYSSNLVADRFTAGLRPGLQPARELLASWIVHDRPNSITMASSLAAR